MTDENANPKLDRSFTYNSVNLYYKYKISHFGNPSDLVLPTAVFNTPDGLCQHLESVAKERGIPLSDSINTGVDDDLHQLPIGKVCARFYSLVDDDVCFCA
jgi:hypothetical protein